MKLHSFSLFIKEAFKDIFLNKLMSLATIIILTAGVFLFGMTATVTINIFSITDKLEKDFKISVFLDESLEKDEINEVGKSIQKIPNVSKIDFISKDEAFEDLKSRYDNPEFLDGINDGTILRHSYQITLNDLSGARPVLDSLEKIKGIAKVTKIDDKMNEFVHYMNSIQIGTIIISIILVFLAVLIITNTINMSIFSRRKQINIMKYVGATDWYIRWPFVIEGALIGIISSIISLTGIYFIYRQFLITVENLVETMGILTIPEAFPFISVLVFVLGTFLGCVGSIISIRKHLRV